MIKGTTKLLGVIGNPIAHSLSPVMHNAAIEHLGVDYVYLAFPIKPNDLATAVAGFEAIGLQGFNVTIPHKQAIIPLLREVSEIAQAVGAVNTVCWTEQGWVGTNTDVEGFIAPLKALNRDWQRSIAVVLGNGGSARAVVAGCAQLGLGKIQVVGRDRDKLQAFFDSWTESPLSPNLSVHPWGDVSSLMTSADLLVNTTPIGMHPNVDQSPLELPILQTLKSESIAYDLIYTPNPTLFLRQAQHQKAIAINGLEMLVQQGAAALQLWLQKPVPVDVMRRSLQQQLQH